MEHNNKVTLSGKVSSPPTFSHEVFGEKFYTVMLKVKRLSEVSDLLPLTVSERLTEIPLSEGDEITVWGQFRSYNKTEGEKSRLMLTVFAREIKPFDPLSNTNAIELTGYICKRPLFRTTPFMREICDCLLAVNRAYGKSDYIPCIAWGRNAHFMKNLNVGDLITLCGRVQSREYQKKTEQDTTTRTAYEVSICKISSGRCQSSEEVAAGETAPLDSCD